MVRTDLSGRIRLVAAVAAVLLMAGLSPSTARAQSSGGGARPIGPACEDVGDSPFTDVGTAGSALEGAVSCVHAYGVTVGTTATTFSPDVTVNRGQMALFAYRTLQLVEELEGLGEAVAPFPDVAGTPVERATGVLRELAVIAGYADGSYRPGNPVTREQVAKIVATMLEVAGVELPAEPASPFADTASSSFRTWIDQLADLGIVTGTSASTFSPSAPLTRGQMALILARSLAAMVDAELLQPVGETPPPPTTTTTTQPTTPTTEPPEPPDTTGPALVSSNPDDGEVDVPAGVNPTATFDEPLAEGSAAWLLCDGVVVAGDPSVDGAALTFIPDGRLAPVAVCAMTFEAVDAAGNVTVAGIGFTTEEDETGPALTGSTPADGATGVKVSAEPSAQFDELLAEGSTASVSCRGESQPGPVTVDGAGIAVDPTGALPYETSCTALFVVFDADGNRTVTGVGFRTEADTYAPTPTGTVPSPGSGDVPVDTVFSATFTEALAAEATVDLSCDGEPVPGVVSVDGTTVTFTPAEDLPDDANCSVTATVADRAGNPTTLSATFATEDLTAPEPTSSAPAEGAVDVAVGANLSATYGEALDPGSTASLVCDGAPVDAVASVVGSLLSLDPVDDLPSGAACSVTFAGRDAAGNADPVTVGFTVADVAAPALVTSTPAESTSGVSTDLATVSATFDEALASSSAGSLSCDGTPVPTTATVDGATVSLAVGAPLPSSGGCTASFEVADIAGNLGVTAVAFTVVDVVAPTSTATVPAAGQSGVGVGVSPEASFTEALDPVRSSATLACPGGEVAGTTTVVYGRALSFDPVDDLEGGATCTVVFNAFDLAGNAADPVTVTFTTVEADTTPPAIASHTAAYGNRSFSVTFTEPIDREEALNPSNFLIWWSVNPSTHRYNEPISITRVSPTTLTFDFGRAILCGNQPVRLFWTAWDVTGNRGRLDQPILSSCSP